MVNLHALTRMALAVNLIATVASAGQKSNQPLTERDRAEIQQLSASYARAIGTCDADEYASLFESPDGFYESLFRGRVMGKAKLIALVNSEPQCSKSAADRSGRPVPTAIIEVSSSGVTGRIPLDSGHYEDVYVKTASGWRFRSRNNIPKKAEEAGFTFRDFAEIRELAGDHGQFKDVYTKTQEGVVFRSSGMTIDPLSRQEAAGSVHLKDDDGRYNDVYVRTANGWRFKSRTYVPAEEGGGPRAAR